MDESGKINLNALMKLDPTGQVAFDVLMKLPNMTEGIAGAIVDWMDPDSDVRTDSAENDYYMGLSPAYRCKNGPIDSIDELLLVKGITADLLYGSDLNRNGIQDANEVTGSDGFTRGWAAFLTVHSREQNYDADGTLYPNLNNKDLNLLLTGLSNSQLSENTDLVKFIIMYRQYGPYSATGGTQSLAGAITSLLTGGASSTSTKTVEGNLADFTLATKDDGTLKTASKYTMSTLFELVDAKVGIKTTMGKTTVITVYTSPLSDAGVAKDMLPKLLSLFSLVDDQETRASHQCQHGAVAKF